MKQNFAEFIKKNKLFTLAQARKSGIYPNLIAYYQKRGLLERVGWGLYKNTSVKLNIPSQWEDLVYAVMGIPSSCVCLVSALALYEMTDEIPRKHWIAIDNKRFPIKRPGVKIIRMRNMQVGQSSIKLGEIVVPIFDKERTVVDAFRYLSLEVAIKALKTYLQQGKPDFDKLHEYAKKLRVKKIIPYILSLTT